MLPPITEQVSVPKGVTFEIVGSVIKAKGPKGENEKSFSHPKISISQDESHIILTCKKPTKKEKAMIYSFAAHIRNLLEGVVSGFVYKVKICSSHFPMSVSVEKDEVIIKNFLGEKISRKSKIVPGTAVKIDGSTIIIEGIDKEKASLTASRIEQATRITNRDRRVFQDGCYIIETPGKNAT